MSVPVNFRWRSHSCSGGNVIVIVGDSTLLFPFEAPSELSVDAIEEAPMPLHPLIRRIDLASLRSWWSVDGETSTVPPPRVTEPGAKPFFLVAISSGSSRPFALAIWDT